MLNAHHELCLELDIKIEYIKLNIKVARPAKVRPVKVVAHQLHRLCAE